MSDQCVGLVQLPEALVEFLILASIVFVAAHNIVGPSGTRGWSRLAMAFFFGLFHGVGFAGGLLDLMQRIPRETVLWAIMGFSLGIEAGNQMVLLPLFGALGSIRHLESEAGSRVYLARLLQKIGSAGVSVAGPYYLRLALIASGSA